MENPVRFLSYIYNLKLLFIGKINPVFYNESGALHFVEL